MNLEKYPVVSSHNFTTYEFLSVGPKGTIRKVAFFDEVKRNYFNLSFGDWDEKLQTINDLVRSNNNDRDKVLVTVASIVIDFMQHHKNVEIFVKGSTDSRTRLYQIGIFKNMREINQLFEVHGFADNKWQPFVRNKSFAAFVLKGK